MSTRQDKSLHDACGKGHLRKVREILQNNIDISSRLDQRIGFLGYTPLHEAACQGHADILQLLLIYGGNVDAMANGNYTPLHIAASMDYVNCIKVLLKNGANIKALDDFNKTPYQTAVQHRRRESSKCLKSAEIIRAAGTENPQELTDLLHETSTQDITASCFDDALLEACHRGNFEAACMLLVAGAKKVKESICISIRNGHYRISSLLMVCYATLQGDVDALEMLLDKSLEKYEWFQQFVDESVPLQTVVESIRESLKKLEDYTNVAIRLPRLHAPNQVIIIKELLLHTSCKIKEKKVNWSKLSLSTIDESWLDPVKSWVQCLNISHNRLSAVPGCLVNLKLVVRLNLSNNRLKIAPSDLFSMISLRELNLSGNAISELPEIVQWRPLLKSLNLSDNKLSSLPYSIAKSCIETLNLSENNFTRVPPAVCQIISLKDLDLSDNREINILPDNMGRLRNLIHINLRNLDQITDPPEHVRNNAEELVATLRRKLRSCEPYYTMKLMLVGKGGQGKTTLVHRLNDDYTYKENDLTQGVEISDLSIRRGGFNSREFKFKVWDFGGQEDYYATHQCFLSTMSLYLLVWRLIDSEEGVESLTPWLDNIALRSPGSTVIVVGTHLDCISSQKHGPNFVPYLNHLVRMLVDKPRYKCKVIVPPDCICAVSCAFGGSRTEVNSLRQIIYNTAAGLKKGRTSVMGELIPSSFISLIERIEKKKAEMKQKKELPIIRKEEFDAMVKENSLQSPRDIQEQMDVRDATVFLRERGVVMHFDDPNEGLSDLYFIEPRWLCALMARVITVKNYADLVKDGVLEIQETNILFHSEELPFEFREQYIRLLVRFQIAYLLDASRILVPSKLPEKEPEILTTMQLPYAPVRRVYKIDYQRMHGFWARFMSRFFFYVKEMIAVDATRYQKAKDREQGFFGHFCRSCLRVDASEKRKFPCFIKDPEWETCRETEGSRRVSDGSTCSSGSMTNTTPHSNRPTETQKDSSVKDRTTNVPSSKESARKDGSSKKSSKKASSKREFWNRKSSKKEAKSKDLPEIGKPSPARDNTPSSASVMPNYGATSDLATDGHLHALLLDPSVKVFSDAELRDETDGDRIVINQVDTAMDFNRGRNSFYDKKTESVKRVGLDLRIPSYDGSLDVNRKRSSNRRSQNHFIPNHSGEKYEKQTSDSSGNETRSSDSNRKDEANRKGAKDDDAFTTTGEDIRKDENVQSKNVDSLNRSGDFPDNIKASEDIPKTTDELPTSTENEQNSAEDISVGNREIPKESEENDQPTNKEEGSTSDTVFQGEALDQVDTMIKDDSVDNVDDISEGADSECSKGGEAKGAIRIPTTDSAESDENASFLSCSDVCSLSSWRENKGLPSLKSPSSVLEDDSFSESMSECFAGDKKQTRLPSVSSDNSRTSVDGQGFNVTSQSAFRERVASSEADPRNSVSKSGSTASSVRNDEPTDTECDLYSESLSSVSTANSNENLQSELSNKHSESNDNLQNETVPNFETLPDKTNVVQSPDVIQNGFPSHEGKKSTEKTDNCNSTDKKDLIGIKDCKNEINGSGEVGSVAVDVPAVTDSLECEDITDAGDKYHSTENVVKTSKSVGAQSESVADELNTGSPETDGVGDQSDRAGAHSMTAESNSGSSSANLGNVGARLARENGQSESDGEQSEDRNPEPETGVMKSESVETEKCSLCKEDVAVNELVTIPLDVGELMELKLVHCWLSGVCFAHPEVFLVVAHRQLPDSVVVEIAVSPNLLGRRLLTFVVDHLDTLIKEWYPGLLMSFGVEPTVQKLIPCRSCEKDGNPRPHIFTFDSCVTQYSMGNFVKCPEHEVSIQDIAPDVVLQDIDADLLLQEDELTYERSEANKIGKGAFGEVYRGRCRGRDAAIKEYTSPVNEEDAIKRYCEVRNEVNILRRVGQHPYLVNLIGVCLRPFRLVLELAMEGSLAKTLFDRTFQIERVVMYRMLHQVADALSFLHTLKITYRDLKPQNVLVMSYEETDDVNIKLTDFGTAAFQFSEGLMDLVGTVGYYAPEMLKEFCKRTGYDEKVDVFSLAMLVYGFITRRPPFHNITTSAEVNNLVVSGRRPAYDDVIAARMGLAGLTWLMESCLAFEPSERHSTSTVAEQLRSTSFQLFLGIIALPCKQSARHVCLVQSTMELWVAVDDKTKTALFVYDLKGWCLKKTITINRLSSDDPVLCLQVNCMHATETEVLIGLRGDRDVVAIYGTENYKLKAKIIVEEPVFSLSSNDSYIFLGMSNGVCLVATRTHIVHPMEISHSEPVTCVLAVNKYLWFTAGKCIQIFHAEGNEKPPVYELNSVRFGASSAPFSQIVLHDSDIWCISKGDSIVTAWNIDTRQKTLEIDCKSFLPSECDLLESAVTCVVAVLDTVWIGTGGGKLLIVDVTSGELITALKLFDDHVRTLTLVPGPGPCGTEKSYVAVSGRKVLETALSRECRGKHVCRLTSDVIQIAPSCVQTTPLKRAEKGSRFSRKSPFGRARSSAAETTQSDVEDSAVNYPGGSVLMFFEAVPAEVLRRMDSK